MPKIIGFCSSVLIAEKSFVCYLGTTSLCFCSNIKFGAVMTSIEPCASAVKI